MLTREAAGDTHNKKVISRPACLSLNASPYPVTGAQTSLAVFATQGPESDCSLTQGPYKGTKSILGARKLASVGL